MKDYPREVEWLISQRNQLVNELSKTNATFHKIVLAFFAALITIVAAENFYKENGEKLWDYSDRWGNIKCFLYKQKRRKDNNCKINHGNDERN